MKTPVYFDYAATTPVDKRVAEKMMRYLTTDGVFGNPASRSHLFGWKAEEAVEEAREEVARLLNADTREIVWTSGATEADNLAIKGVARFYRDRGRHIVTAATEHKAVLDTCRQLEREGFEVTYLNPDSEGIISADQVGQALRDDTILVSLMHVNNETGTVTDVEAIGAMTRERGIFFHVDAAQSAGKIPIDTARMNIDLMSVCAHKIYGPKGVGALYVRRKPRVRLEAMIHGGGHERGMRSGTLPVHQLAGMGEAFRLARELMDEEVPRIRQLRDRLRNSLTEMEETFVNGSQEHCVCGIVNVSFNFVEGESLLMALKDIALSSGSACTSASLEPSYVLRALGRSDELAHSSLRFSLGRFTTTEEVDYAVSKVRQAVSRLRELSPLWDMYRDGVDLRKLHIKNKKTDKSCGVLPPEDKDMAYSEKVIDHYENPRNVGKLDDNDEQVGTGMVGAPACGDVMRLQIRVNDDGVIEDARFKTYGCGSAIASSSLATEWMKNKTLDEALDIRNKDIAEELALPPVKIHCSVLAEDAIKEAIRDYRRKQESRQAGA